SLADFDIRVAAAASLLLACKIEEAQRRLKDIVLVFYRLHMRALEDADGQPVFPGPTPSLEPKSQNALEMRKAIMTVEKQILKEFGFAMSTFLQPPHRYLLQFLRRM
ncbi:CYCL1-1, partial [Symbiodinium sp. CCMP2456]